jgi:hypothetical protein
MLPLGRLSLKEANNNKKIIFLSLLAFPHYTHRKRILQGDLFSFITYLGVWQLNAARLL